MYISQELFIEKLDYVTKEYEVPISWVSASLGYAKTTLYSIRNQTWRPEQAWFRRNLENLKLLEQYLEQYRRYIRTTNADRHSLEETPGKYSFSTTSFARWTFLLWTGELKHMLLENIDPLRGLVPDKLREAHSRGELTKEERTQQHLLNILDKL